MAMFITNDCTYCGLCITNCPNKAIYEGEMIYIINPDLCTECEELNYQSQCKNVCPADAIIKNLDKLKK